MAQSLAAGIVAVGLALGAVVVNSQEHFDSAHPSNPLWVTLSL